MGRHRHHLVAVATLLALALLSAACSSSDGNASPTTSDASSGDGEEAASPEEAGLDLAPASARIDLETPVFSNPTEITNVYFPISDLQSVVLLGNLDGRMFRTETTLLPDPKTIELDGESVDALVSQYVAYVDGRVEEVALDWYAQADDGAVWYLGEDVFNYDDGSLSDTEGTWIAGPDAPPAMIMSAEPAVGQAFRPENAWPVVFEEVVVRAVDRTVEGPRGPVSDAVVTEELHMDGGHETKVFAPGYGEFSTGVGGDLEALALAVPTDALDTPTPPALTAIVSAALDAFDAAGAADWAAADAAVDTAVEQWRTHRATGDQPPLLAAQMERTLRALAGDNLAPAVADRNVAGAQKAALDVATAALDLQLRHRPPVEVDTARFALWARQLQVDATVPETGPVVGDVTVLDWIQDRFEASLDDTAAADIESVLDDLRQAAEDEDLDAAADGAAALLAIDVVAGALPA